MKKLAYDILNLYLYSSLHIAICAAMITAFSYLLIGIDIDYEYVFFIGSSTLLLYSFHRIVGMNKVKAFENEGRYAIIKKYRSHIFIYSLLATVISVYFFLKFRWDRQLFLILPCLLSALYILPVFGKKMRLRDVHFIKIFLIAVSWALLTCTIPLYESLEMNALICLSLERMLFIFAITIPFDIRDLDVDMTTGVKTIPQKTGVRNAKILALTLLLIGFGIMFLSQDIFAESRIILMSITITYIVTAILVLITNVRKSDYFFTFLMDGTMALGYVAYILLQLL